MINEYNKMNSKIHLMRTQKICKKQFNISLDVPINDKVKFIELEQTFKRICKG